jgi:hypothetical protein
MTCDLKNRRNQDDQFCGWTNSQLVRQCLFGLSRESNLPKRCAPPASSAPSPLRDFQRFPRAVRDTTTNDFLASSLRTRLVCLRSAYVADSTSSLVQNVRRNLVHLVNGHRVFRNLLQDILVRVAPCFESTTGIQVITSQDSPHLWSPCEDRRDKWHSTDGG